MTNEEILQQLVQVVLPKLVTRIKAVEDHTKALDERIQNLKARTKALEERMPVFDASVLTAINDRLFALEEAAAKPKTTRTRRKRKVEEPEVTEAQEQAINAEMAAMPDPVDAMPDPNDVGYFQALYDQGIRDVDLAVNAYGVDREAFINFLAAQA